MIPRLFALLAALRTSTFFVLTAFVRLISLLPLGGLQRIGAILGRLVVRLAPRYRRHLLDNLAQAGYPLAADPGRPGRVGAAAGRGALELAYLWMRSQQQVLARTRAEGWAVVDEARREGRGIVFLTPHLGCFEVTAQFTANDPVVGAPLTVLYRPSRQAWLAPLVEGRRARGRLSLAPADLSGVRKLVRALKRGEAVGMLPDQVPSRGEGVWADFFGRPAYTMTLPARLCRLTGAALLLAHGERLADGRGWIVHFTRLPTPLPDDPVEAATRINAALEALIRTSPDQYLWGYNRYKTPQSAPPAPSSTVEPLP